ncbi:MAG: hypothetical protein QXP77_01805, partial [Candidatus Aenigmatarchaeota archaeon]
MSQAVKFALEFLKNINKELLEKSPSYLYHINGFFRALDIRQGDYKISGIEKDGLVIEYLRPKADEKKEVKIEEIDFEKLKSEKEEQTKDFLELLEYAIEKERYKIEVRDYGKEIVEKVKNGNGRENQLTSSQEIIEFYKIYEIFPAIFEIYLKNSNMLLGELYPSPFGDFFIIRMPIHPEAIYIMKKIGERIFECKDG